MAAFKTTVFSCLVTLMLTLFVVESINAELDNGDITMAKDDMLRALYNYILYERKGAHDFDGFERAQRSGKPTFIRFGKRSANIVTNPENI
uniref:FMRFa-like protein 2 n=1 Tax=Ascaris suum TaxID=6253 RepID=H2D5R7_ASCSU|nr:FMRFa-like protein precursor 2 [Ascaris suum]